MNVGARISDDDPLKIAWDKWWGSEDGRNAAKWGSAISVSIVDNQSTISHPHLEGALWGAFIAGHAAGTVAEIRAAPKSEGGK